MKSLICSLVLILSVLVSKAQFPITSTQGSVTTLTKPLGGLQAGVGMIMTVYTDTTTANLNAYLKTYNGALIYSLSDSALYFRSNGASKWVQILPSGGTTGLNAWLVGGNTPLLTDANGNATFGANQNSGIIFRTNSLTRLILDKGGIVRSSGAANKYLTYDTITKQLYYGDAASVANEWHITGNSGTTAGTNFVGTTDNVDLIFKRNSVLSGIIGSSNTSFGFGSSNSFTSGHNNTALGINSLHFTTSGSYNTAIGQASLYNNTTGGNNISVGENSLQANTTGTSNTAIGMSSMYSNISGDSNIAVGSQAGYYSTTLSKRLYFNSISRGNILGDSTKSIIYGRQNTLVADQQLYLNATGLYFPYVASGVGTKALRINPGTGLITYADTTAASSTPTLQQVTDAGNTTTNTMKTPAILFHDIGNNKTVTVQPDDLDNNYIQMLRPKSGNIALYPLDSTATPENTITIGADGYFHRAALGGSSLFPLTGTGTATGSVTGDLASNTLSIMNGFVGIGIAMPTSALQVYGNIDNIGLGDVTFGQGVSRIATNSTLVNLGDLGGSASNEIFTIDANNKYAYYDNNPHDTKFGINTSTPSVALDVVGDVKLLNTDGLKMFIKSSLSTPEWGIIDENTGKQWAQIKIGQSSFGDLSGFVNGNKFKVDDDNSTAYYDNAAHTGFFGINTSTPSVALDVVGDVKLSSNGTYTNGLIKTESSGGNAIVYLGDYTAVGNGTGISIDDVNQTMNFNNSSVVVGFQFNTGTVQMNAYGAGAATFDASGNITSVSDERLKTNIKPYKTGLKELLLINPIQYNWNEKSKMETKGTYAGFSAQNVKANIPFGTGENKEGYLSLQDRSLLATAFNAIKELSAKVDKLESQNKQLLKQLGATGKPKKIKLKY